MVPERQPKSFLILEILSGRPATKLKIFLKVEVAENVFLESKMRRPSAASRNVHRRILILGLIKVHLISILSHKQFILPMRLRSYYLHCYIC